MIGIRAIATKTNVIETKVQKYFELDCNSELNQKKAHRSALSYLVRGVCLFHFVDNSLERFRMVHCQISKHLTVEFNTVLVHLTHELRV